MTAPSRWTLDITFRQVRDGYLTGRAVMFGVRHDVEAFRVQPDDPSQPDNQRPKRMLEMLQGLLIDDVPLKTVEIPGHEGTWLLFIYPGEHDQFAGIEP
jgi:hypothetical protein